VVAGVCDVGCVQVCVMAGGSRCVCDPLCKFEGAGCRCMIMVHVCVTVGAGVYHGLMVVAGECHGRCRCVRRWVRCAMNGAGVCDG
jgi:hypothetical protein